MPGIDSDLIRGHIDTIILNILGEGDKYGYEICKEVEVKSNGAYELKQPTLYSCLKRLESQGLISSYWEDSDIGGKRHYYKLTEDGQLAYRKNQEDWKRSKQIIDNLISTDSPAPKTETESNVEKQENANNSTQTDAEDYDYLSGEKLIFDEIDKEVENQDQGLVDVDSESEFFPNKESELEKQNGLEIVKDEQLPFENNDYSSYCVHLVKNDKEDDKTQTQSETTTDLKSTDDDILSLLGHYDNKETQTQNEEEVAVEPENEFLAKFITGKYSEYNPNREEYIEALKQKEQQEKEQKLLEEELKKQEELEKANALVTEDLSEINDAEEFKEDDVERKISSYFDTVDAESAILDAPEITEKNSPAQPSAYAYENKVSDDTNSNQLKSFENSRFNQNNVDSINENQYNTEQFESVTNKNSDNNPYSNITYFNINTPKEEEVLDVTSDEVLNDFANKYDADLPVNNDSDEIVLDLSKNQDDDAIVMDFSQNNDNENEAETPQDKSYNANEEDDYSSFMADLEESGVDPKDVKPFENKIDLTSVYDKTGNTSISPTYTDIEAKQKLNELAGGNINAKLLDDSQNDDTEQEMKVDESLSGEVKPLDNTIRPKDLSNLKSDLQQEGITVRPYYKSVKEPPTTKTFIETNKIKMVRNWIVFFVEAVLLGITLLIVNRLNITQNTFMDTYIYFVCGLAVILILAMFSTIKYWINPYKKVTAKYAPRISHLFALLFTVQFFVIIYCINLQFGFYSFSQTNYNHLNWIVPCVVCLCPIIQSIVYEILYKSKNFHI